MRSLDGGFEERRLDGEFGGLDRAVGAARRADAHERGTRALHDRLDVGEVEVDETRRGDEVGDALHTGQEHLVGRGEGLDHRDAAVADLEQSVVGHDDEGVDLFFQAGHSPLGLALASATLEREGLGDDTDREGADRLGDLGHHRSAAGARATAFARGHEDHVGSAQRLFDLFGVVLGGTATHLGIRTGPEAARQLTSDVELDVGVAHQQRLRIGVDRDELHAAQAELDHAVDGVDAASAHTDDLDDGEVVLVLAHAGLRYPRT